MNTEDVRAAYQTGRDRFEDLSGETRFYAGQEFDAWLKEEKAQAWAEGFNDATDEAHTAHEEYPNHHENPYRRTE